ncbi:MAG: GNAT family N-acetyltransferase [Pseudomonadota bacterium]
MRALDIPVLETERLRLRAPSEDDMAAEVAFYASERSRFVGGPIGRDLVWRGLAGQLGHWVLRGYGMWAVEEIETGIYCGSVGPWYPDGWPEPEIGWALVDGAEGRGIAREAAEAARRYAYGTLGWTTAISLIDPANARSIALAERMGARFERDYDHPSKGRMAVYRHPAPQDLG